MSVKRSWEDDAGPWVAWQDAPRKHARTGEMVTMRSYVYDPDSPWHSWTTKKADAARFDTKAEAERFVRNWSPRSRGVRTGAERVWKPNPNGAGWVRDD